MILKINIKGFEYELNNCDINARHGLVSNIITSDEAIIKFRSYVYIIRRNYDKGDKITIVSLSSGILGESFSAHQLKIGKKRLEDLGFEVVFYGKFFKGLKILQENQN